MSWKIRSLKDLILRQSDQDWIWSDELKMNLIWRQLGFKIWSGSDQILIKRVIISFANLLLRTFDLLVIKMTWFWTYFDMIWSHLGFIWFHEELPALFSKELSIILCCSIWQPIESLERGLSKPYLIMWLWEFKEVDWWGFYMWTERMMMITGWSEVLCLRQWEKTTRSKMTLGIGDRCRAGPNLSGK